MHPIARTLAPLSLLLAACAGPDRGVAGVSGAATPRAPAAPAEELVYLASSLDADELAELRAVAPDVRFVSGLDRESALAHAAEADGADAHLLTPELLAAAPDLRWVQSWSAGVDRYLGLERLMTDERIVFTNMKAMHGPVIAEHVFAMLLARTRALDDWRRAQREGRWNRGAAGETTALAGRTLLVVGMGGIGGEVAKRAHAFEMRVLATVRTRRPAPEYVDRLETGAELDALLPEADFVVICLPLTPETEGLFDQERVERMKAGAVLVNIARGPIVDTDALLAALESGHLGGACLDVTDPEPLPAGHPLWARADVTITPHVASRAPLTGERSWALFLDNAGRFARGEALVNVVDKEAGY